MFGDGGNAVEREVLTGVLTTLYRVEEAKIKEILAEGKTAADILAEIRTLDANRVSTLKKEAENTKFQEGYKKAKGETLSQFEASVKEKYGIQDDTLIGLDLLDAVISAQAKASGSSEEEIRKSPVYLKLEREMKAALKKAEEDAAKKLADIETGYKKKMTFAKVTEKALIALDALNPIYASNAAVAATHKRGFLGELQTFDYETNDGGEIITMIDGKRKEDAHGHAVSFEEHVKEVAARHFEFKANNGGGNGGNGGDGGNGGGAGYPAGIKKPTNQSELAAIINDKSIKLEDRRKVMDAYEKEYGKK